MNDIGGFTYFHSSSFVKGVHSTFIISFILGMSSVTTADSGRMNFMAYCSAGPWKTGGAEDMIGTGIKGARSLSEIIDSLLMFVRNCLSAVWAGPSDW